MIDGFPFVLTLVTALACGLVAGFFFAFSTTSSVAAAPEIERRLPEFPLTAPEGKRPFTTTPRTAPSKITGSTSTSATACADSPVWTLKAPAGTPSSMSLRFSIVHCPTRPSPRSTSLPCVLLPPEA